MLGRSYYRALYFQTLGAGEFWPPCREIPTYTWFTYQVLSNILSPASNHPDSLQTSDGCSLEENTSPGKLGNYRIHSTVSTFEKQILLGAEFKSGHTWVNCSNCAPEKLGGWFNCCQSLGIADLFCTGWSISRCRPSNLLDDSGWQVIPDSDFGSVSHGRKW